MTPLPTLLLLAICLIVICNTNGAEKFPDLTETVKVEQFSKFIEGEVKKDKLLSLQEELEMLNNPNEYLLNSIKKEHKGKDWDKATTRVTGKDGKSQVSISIFREGGGGRIVFGGVNTLDILLFITLLTSFLDLSPCYRCL